MRQNLLRSESKLLRYPIRELVEIGKNLESLGNFTMIWENIGDPVAAGESIPSWMKAILRDAIEEDKTYGYTDSRGDVEARQYVLDNFSDDKVCTIDDILFFNGLGEAINKILNKLPKEARVLVPSPTYPSHATAEAMHASCDYISYQLDPENNWEPDLEEIENHVHYNEQIVAILVINPNNPTGSVLKRETLEKIVAIAKKYDCFLIFDEIYHHMVFPDVENTLLYEIIGDTPGISMKGISKDVPWPGSRCGWIEIYNAEKDDHFNDYIKVILLTKMLEVCSTSLPQKVLPKIYGHPEFDVLLAKRIAKYLQRAEEASAFFENISQVRLVQPKGVFYLVIELLDLPYATLESKNKKIRLALNELEKEDIYQDFQFSYELMGAEGICVVPLSGFGSELTGFRMTMLEESDTQFTETLMGIARAIEGYYR
ncbi:MAG: pyridoxal phosphate-dependent aminotransferase [Thiotrichaceae bacterium]|nr:pyridoxal phosphate-dependent aminotransferase [Thiotrichaceae bacterium]